MDIMVLTPERYIERLVQISRKKYILLKEMVEIAQRQSVCNTENDIDIIQQLVSAKQVKITEIDKLDEEFDVYFCRLKTELGVGRLEDIKNLKIEGTKELQEVIASIMSIVREIKALDEQNKIKVQGILDHLANEIKKLNQGKKVNSIYNRNPVYGPSYFVDKKK